MGLFIDIFNNFAGNIFVEILLDRCFIMINIYSLFKCLDNEAEIAILIL